MNSINVDDEIMEGKPSILLEYLQREIGEQILQMSCNNWEDVTNNMRLFADVFEMLEEHINDDYICLKYNPTGSWYVEYEDREIPLF